jgi:hypothetical protein
MKKMNKILSLAALFAVGSHLNAARHHDEKHKKASEPVPTFELFNRDQDVVVSVKVGHAGREIHRKELKKDHRLLLPKKMRPISKDEKITIYFYTAGKKERNPSYSYEIDAPGKTKYVEWKSKMLQRQQGKLFGFTQTSDSGYSLKNNVKNDNIKKIEPVALGK